MHPKQDRSAESLEARLRALPPPPVPSDLEARLLAAIPASAPSAVRRSQLLQRRWLIWAGVGGALAAASLLVVLFWPKSSREDLNRIKAGFANQDTPRPPHDSPDIAHVQFARQVRDDTALPPFTWPIEETTPLTASISIPSDLLN